ncbi:MULTISPECIES: AraC family transcriptional regulator [unclassified Pseudomonas]|uniref:AraC family transcriptional regulator n=1 Tax=unclassified Pseudomonas TaxID=196821 RepID=UPI000373741B|nr:MULTISPECIES: AraC family transcriptional regulator [unclassified Pseudomonas]MCF5230393.1 helix-turn-helix domain-containing protein [Pseudomonas sp. PA-5-4H]MCF5236739.1 helix-turn-helix domain-containing protein [Pseudomonas sp. PA-5-4G]MCF5246955.1 helix-turn-helix domain-containing protein [Pseudomonas sp. PA-5-4B]MCF5255105.1 helix-turn-helix domain-containing protein [Pseudomonas sp. PA-5-4B]MCF5261125.1 helix-turn-helix domain-containing protein [Pseudomonas sp. PA-5-4A]
MTRAMRITDPSYELMDDHNGLSIIYRQHGFPCPLVRWHFHKEYELHLIVASSGKVFIGDYIGNFYPESLFLTGPNLPHNWISQVEEDEVVPKRDMLVNFTDELFEQGSPVFAELKTLAPMLERAQYGIEFRCKKTIAQAMTLMQRIEDAQGIARLGHFFILLEVLSACDDYQLLSGVTTPQLADEHSIDRTNRAVDYIFAHYARELSLEEVAEHLGMKPTYFSRVFKQATGRTFIEFVNRLRISKSCELLADGDKAVTDVCFESGFNNISNFNRRFQQLKGMTPSHYRRLAVQRLTEQNLA